LVQRKVEVMLSQKLVALSRCGLGRWNGRRERASKLAPTSKSVVVRTIHSSVWREAGARRAPKIYKAGEEPAFKWEAIPTGADEDADDEKALEEMAAARAKAALNREVAAEAKTKDEDDKKRTTEAATEEEAEEDYFVTATGDVEKDIATGNARLRKHLRAREYMELIDEFNAMVDDHQPRNAITYEMAMTAFNEEDGFKETLLVWDEATQIGIEKSGNMYAHYMRALFKMGEFERMIETFKSMIENDIPRSPAVYTVLVEFYASKNNLQAIQEAERMMEYEGIQLDLPLADALLSFYMRTNRSQDAFRLLEQMQKLKLELGVIPTAVLAERAVQQGKIEEAETHMKYIQFHLVQRVPQFVFDALISHYLSRDDQVGAERVLGRMRAAGYKVGVDTARHFVTYYAARNDSARVSFYLQELRSTGRKPDAALYEALLDMYYKQRNLAEFKAIFNEVLDRHITPARAFWTKYLDLTAHHAEELSTIDRAFDYVKQTGHALTQEEYSFLIQAYCRFRQYVESHPHFSIVLVVLFCFVFLTTSPAQPVSRSGTTTPLRVAVPFLRFCARSITWKAL
jgi:pentatricopeptide repeat protein